MSIRLPGKAEISWHSARPKILYLGSCRALARMRSMLAQNRPLFNRPRVGRGGGGGRLRLGAVWEYNGGMKKLFWAAACLALALVPIFAQGQDEAKESGGQKQSPHSFSLLAEAAYYPESAAVAANGERFAPITGFYSGGQLGLTGLYEYMISIPGKTSLTKGNNAVLGAQCQISPGTIKPNLFLRYSPIAFLVFGAGAKCGTGWEFMGSQCLATFNSASGKFDNITPFKNWFYEFDVSATFQFDAAALWPGDWHHIVFMASYDFRLSGMTGQADGHPWVWEADFPKVNGANYYANVILGWQLPFKRVSLVGVQAEFEGFYERGQIAEPYRAFDIDFCRVNVSPLVVFSLTKKDTLFALLYFERRRGFDRAKGYVNGREQSELEMNCSGGEWHFRRLALRYVHKF